MCLEAGDHADDADAGTHTLARLHTEVQTAHAALFERNKAAASGLHFLAVQTAPDAPQPESVWLLRSAEGPI